MKKRMQFIRPEWRLRFRLFAARVLIKLGKLSHADYSAKELTDIANQHLPETFTIDAPASKGELSLLEAQISMPQKHNAINVELLGSIIIGPRNKPIYRAHLIIHLAAHPIYEVESNTVKLAKMLVNDVKLVNDKYLIIEDSRELLGLVFPRQLQSLLTGTVKSAFGFITAGGTDLATDYLKLYLTGSKQRILDYHRPQIEKLVSDFAQSDELKYELNPEEFEEKLFCLYGKDVVVEEGCLRFKF